MKAILSASLIGLTLAAAASAFADNRAPGVHQRQHNQKARIADGVRSGELTKEESRSLRAQQRAIRAEKREFKSDGHLSRAERRELHSDQNEASRDIYREKHDNDKR